MKRGSPAPGGVADGGGGDPEPIPDLAPAEAQLVHRNPRDDRANLGRNASCARGAYGVRRLPQAPRDLVDHAPEKICMVGGSVCRDANLTRPRDIADTGDECTGIRRVRCKHRGCRIYVGCTITPRNRMAQAPPGALAIGREQRQTRTRGLEWPRRSTSHQGTQPTPGIRLQLARRVHQARFEWIPKDVDYQTDEIRVVADDPGLEAVLEQVSAATVTNVEAAGVAGVEASHQSREPALPALYYEMDRGKPGLAPPLA